MTDKQHHSAVKICRDSLSIGLLFAFLAAAVCSASAQTRTWTNSTNTQFNNFNNWDPTGTWANGDTLRFNGTVGGNLNLYYQGGQNAQVRKVQATKRVHSGRDDSKLNLSLN